MRRTISCHGTAKQDELQPGPVNDYSRVIDVDPASRQFYTPVISTSIPAAQTAEPVRRNPQFHQQMVLQWR